MALLDSIDCDVFTQPYPHSLTLSGSSFDLSRSHVRERDLGIALHASLAVSSLSWFLEKRCCLRCHSSGWMSCVLDEFHLVESTPNKLTRCWLDEGLEARKVGIIASSQGDAIHKRRKSTTKFTFALSRRADYILHSKVMAKATCSGEKIVQEGSLRNSSMVSWETYTFYHEATEGQPPRVPSGILLVAFCIICPFCAFFLYFPSCAL